MKRLKKFLNRWFEFYFHVGVGPTRLAFEVNYIAPACYTKHVFAIGVHVCDYLSFSLRVHQSLHRADPWSPIPVLDISIGPLRLATEQWHIQKNVSTNPDFVRYKTVVVPTLLWRKRTIWAPRPRLKPFPAGQYY